MLPILTAVLESSTWRDRERYLNRAYVRVAETHNNLGITGPVDPSVSHFHNRPYLVIHADRFVAALWGKLDSTFLKSIKRKAGSVDQFSDSTDIFSWNDALQYIGGVYDL